VVGLNQDFIGMKLGDFPEMTKSDKNVVFLSPSWGGPSYNNL